MLLTFYSSVCFSDHQPESPARLAIKNNYFTGTKGHVYVEDRSVLVYNLLCAQSYWLNQLNSSLHRLLSLLDVVGSFVVSSTAFNPYFLISLPLSRLMASV